MTDGGADAKRKVRFNKKPDMLPPFHLPSITLWIYKARNKKLLNLSAQQTVQ